MKQHIIGYFRKHYKENISLLLILAMVLSFVPGVYAMEEESETVEETIVETISETAPETILETIPETTPETIPETIPETTPETIPETIPETTPETTPETIPETVPETTPETVPDVTEVVKETFAEQLLLLPTLKEVFDAMMANAEAVYAMTEEELAELKAYTQSLYEAIEEPTGDDDEYLELIVDTVDMMLEERPAPETLEEPEEPDYLYFDLYAGNLTISGSGTSTTLTGYRFDGNNNAQKISTTITGSERVKVYVYQSNHQSEYTQTGIIDGSVIIPEPTRVEGWDRLITNNTDVEGVISAWIEKNRPSTSNRIAVSGVVNCELVLDNVYSKFQTYSKSRQDGGISFVTASSTKNSTLLLKIKGDNRFGNIYYCGAKGNNNKIIFENYPHQTDSGTLTIANIANNANGNYWCAAIGGNDAGGLPETCDGIMINSGTIFAGTNAKDDCSAIGGGGNGYGGITIHGGTITAVVTSSGAAIGGGIGKTSTGGPATVTITGGNIYAYNNSCTSGYSEKGVKYIPAAAIGGGSSARQKCDSSTVNITGGTIYAQSVGGTAIGGGSSADNNGGDCTINIAGGQIEAYSIAGTIGGQAVPAGVAIGGGTGYNKGGSATLNVSGDAVLYTGSIGGGGFGNKSNTNGVIGFAKVNISDGYIRGQVVMEGTGSEFKMSGGIIDNASARKDLFVKRNGGAACVETGTVQISGSALIQNAEAELGGAIYLSNGNVQMSNGTIKDSRAQFGGAVYVTGGNFTITGGVIDNNSAIASEGEGGAVYVSGGNIIVGSQNCANSNCLTVSNNTALNGGAFAVAGSTPIMYCGSLFGNEAKENGGALYVSGEGGFHMYGGTIDGGNKESNAQMGGAVYLASGQFALDGENTCIQNNKAINGAGIYINDGIATIKGTGRISDNTAEENGGGAYLHSGTLIVEGGTFNSNTASSGNGGAAYLGGGTMTVKGGTISNNTASVGDGGAAYLAGGTMSVEGGTICANTAPQGSGGGAYVNGGSVYVNGSAQINENTAGVNGGGICVNNGNFTMEGGAVNQNHAVNGNGGGIYVSSTSSKPVTVSVYTGSVSENEAGISGGALAVQGEGENPILVTIGVNENHFGADGYPEHISEGSPRVCPVINGNTSNSSGGAVYISGSKEAKLCIYCMTETGNVSGDASKPSDFMMVEGGTVEITTEEAGTQENAQDGKHGRTNIRNTIYVVGGDVDIWGTMTNPDISDTITVDIKNGAVDDFDDHRLTGSGGTEYYKLLYYENFTDPATGHTTGLYKQVRVQKGDTVTIDGFIYRHTGYEIGGWNTHPQNEHPLFATHNPDELGEGESFINEGWYNCKEDYLFDGTNRNHLTLYAIWRPIGYAVVFDPNAGENGQYTGKMEDMALKYDEEMPLTKNAFGRPGYYFKEWNTNADGSGQSYADEALVKNLSNEVGKPVTLYAQWTSCDHDPATHTYTYTTSGNVLTGECACKGCTVTATILASDTTYDQQAHIANLDITISSSVTAEVDTKLRNIAVAYELYTLPDEENPEATWTDMAEGKYPINAGKYRASITVSGQTAVKEYTIKKAPQSAPGKPTYMTNKDDASITTDKLQVNEVQQSALVSTDTTNAETGKIGYDCHVEYAVVYDQGDGTQSEPEWQTARDFILNTALTNYYVLVRYSEGTNYEASAPARADSKYFFAGDVSIIVHGVDGVDYRLVEATMDNDVVSGVKLTLTVTEGYYFPNNYAVSQITVKPETNGPLTAVPSPDEGNPTKQVYTVNGIQKNSNIDVYLSPVKKLPTIRSFVTEGQDFTDFTDTEAVISRDSAYTAKFVVENFDASVYTGGIVINGLPDGTPLILMKKCSGTTTYYRANAAGNVALTDFAEMGKENTCFSWNQNEQNVTLQLVAVNSGVISGSSVSTSFALTHSSEQPNAADVSGAVTTTLRNEAEFTILKGDASLTLRYTPSEGTASIWNGRDNALVLKAAAGTTLPEDTKLKYSYGGYNRDCSMNPEGLFVIPLGQLQPGDITLSFTLSTKMKTGTYSLTADWYIARSQAETAPMNGIRKETAGITLSAEKANVSVQISAQKHLYSIGDILSAQIKVRGIEGYTTKLDLQQKVDGVYQSVDVAKTISGDCTQTYNLNHTPGSYRLYLYAYTSYSREETSFYFIIQ